MRIYSLKKIETPRIILRPLQLGDEIEMNKCIDHSIETLKKWMPWAQNSTLAATKEFVYSSVASWKAKNAHNLPLAIIYKPNQKLIGATGFTEDSTIARGIYAIGYWIDLAYRGQGLVTESVNALSRYAFDCLQAKAVHILVKEANHKSIAVPNRLGFACAPVKLQDNINKPTVRDILLFTRDNTSLLPPLEVSWCEDK